VVTEAAARLLIAVEPDLVLAPDGEGRIRATGPHGAFTWQLLPPGTRRALLELGRRAATWERLRELSAGEPAERLLLEVNRLLARSLATLRLADAPGGLVTASPQGPLARIELPLPAARYPVRLSRFAALRRQGEVLVVDSPLGSFLVALCRPAAARLVTDCVTARTGDELAATLLDPPALDAAVRLLTVTGVLVPVGPDGRAAEDDDPGLRQREPHDVQFHARSRAGLTAAPLGGTFRFAGDLPAPPVLRRHGGGGIVPLPRPAAEPAGPGLWEVVRARRSIREHDDEAPVTVEQLGEFLHRVARSDRTIEADPARGRPYGMSDRPYPSGGKVYDLELYLAVRACGGLPPGLYHYRPDGHALERLPAPVALRRRLLLDAARAAGGVPEPQVLIVLASRFHRLSWKYEGISYAVALKNAGVLVELMYLAATALGLAPCALGLGDSAVFSQAVGVPVTEESSVAEFMLGSRPRR
jgi:SagB-type dehydrogenase family enzyme